jgi:Flp pilus assembly protein TadG
MFFRNLQKRTTIARRARKGAASVEFAFCLPVLFMLTFGTIDICTMLFLNESASLAAYEGARRGVGRGYTNADASARVIEFLDERGIMYNAANVCQISDPGFDGAETLEHVTVTVTIPCEGNLLLPSEMIGNLVVSSDVTMRKEYENLDNN